MPMYEFRCRSCGSTFDVQRPMDESDVAAACPEGHTDTVRLLSFAGGVATAPASQAPSSGGGCCGGGCCS